MVKFRVTEKLYRDVVFEVECEDRTRDATRELVDSALDEIETDVSSIGMYVELCRTFGKDNVRITDERIYPAEECEFDDWED